MDAIAPNNHGMMTRSKRKKQNTPNLILQVTTTEDLENSNNHQFMELSEEFLKEEEEKLSKKRKTSLGIDKVEDEEDIIEDTILEEDNYIEEEDPDYIYPEMRDFIVPDDYLSSDEEDIPYHPDEVDEELFHNSSTSDNLREKLDRSEKDLANALATYINSRMEDIDAELEEEINELEEENNLLDASARNSNSQNKKSNQLKQFNHEEIFTTYDSKMKKHFLSLSVEEQSKIIELEGNIRKINNEVIPIRYQVLESDMDVKIKAIAIQKLNALKNLDSSSGEYYKIKSYLEGLMKIPFGKYKTLPISQQNTSAEISQFMIQSNQILDKAVYGHAKAKGKILQILGKWISNPQSKGSVFAILGPMGNGKTTLVKEGIAKMIQRPFEFISLGGATDSSFLDGHSYTYEGSMPGKIVDILKKSKCMNPVIYFDELDKVSSTPRGEEIINLLIHLTDFSQNDVFMDKYYADIPLDLSGAVFIFSLNSLADLNPILRDRMMVIETDKLEEKDKVIISQKYMIPKILEEINLIDQEIIIPEETIKFAIQEYSVEEGVRNLKRCYQTLLEKINIWRLLNFEETNLTSLNFSSQIQNIFQNKISFPLTITPDLLKNIMEESKKEEDVPFMMYS